MIDDRLLRDALHDQWSLSRATVEVHNGGMNSATWFVRSGRHRWVAKAVRAGARRMFAAGLGVATTLEAAGIPAGAPVPTVRGDLVADVEGVPLALLRWVPGEPLRLTGVGGQRLLGATLAQVHGVLRSAPAWDLDADRFHWVNPRAEHLSVRTWIRPAVAGAVAAVDALDPASLSLGLLHTDPAPEAFLRDPATGTVALIDWSTAVAGPLLYDLASAVMYAGGPDRAGPLLATYLGHGVIAPTEVERGLLVMLRFRWAVQADYFAHRIATGDLTGIASAADNETGLADARAWLSRLAR